MCNYNIELLGQLLVTMIGVFAGFTLATWWEKRKKLNEDKKTLQKTCVNITSELDANLKRLDIKEEDIPPITIRNVTLKPSLVLLSSDAINESIYSGKYSLLPTEMQREVSDINTVIGVNNLLVSGANEFLRSTATALSNSEKIFEWQVNNIERSQSILKEEIPPLLEKLKEYS